MAILTALLGRQLKMPTVDWAYRGSTESSSAERHLLNVI
jgi:hypothetical protein